MKFDFSQPAPQAQTPEEAQKIIDALWFCAAKLQAKVANLEEKLNTNSKNSSKSPSSDLFKAKKQKIKQHGAGKSKALKQGAQPGHTGKGRKLLPPESVDHTLICLPETTCDCGGRIAANPNKMKRHQQFELPEIKPIVTEYQLLYGLCNGCGKTLCHTACPTLS